ncbi:uncharacterized [Tachysurus ichikawai]
MISFQWPTPLVSPHVKRVCLSILYVPASASEVHVSPTFLDEAKAPCLMFSGAGPFHTTCLPWKSMSKSPFIVGRDCVMLQAPT